MRRVLLLTFLVSAPVAGQEMCDQFDIAAELSCIAAGPEDGVRTSLLPRCPEAPVAEELVTDRYAALARDHRLEGNACYYSAFFHGRKTANGEIFRNDRHSAAHLTLPLGTLVEIESLATGKKLKLRVNDRGPYTGNFIIDLSRSAAEALGVDKAKDRRVEVRVLALPGEAGEEMVSTAGKSLRQRE